MDLLEPDGGSNGPLDEAEFDLAVAKMQAAAGPKVLKLRLEACIPTLVLVGIVIAAVMNIALS
ncbi:hypothetical protein ACIPWF_10640 [Paenarthrobacter sp. NPDC089989]|uniref:hypothetical protein n=1 Tax=unclassified Paenarthrobacter TaxID=2634190 RepID=UPI0037FCFB37